MIQLQDLTVGHVSGMIAAAVFVVQHFLPIAIPLLLLGVVTEKGSTATTSAITWSVIGRAIHGSLWPTILRSDSAGASGVQNSVSLVTYLTPLTTVLVATAAIVTPLGLYEVIGPSANPVTQYFHYAQDPSPLGSGTPPRSDLGFSRICGGDLFIPCPGSTFPAIFNANHTSIFVPDSYDTRIPRNLTELFSSGLATMNESMSSVFDIQWRTYSIKRDNTRFFNNGSAYLVGGYRQLASHLLNDAIEPVEGLIVDSKNGGIGFRNHSIPPLLPFGATWSEDILFIQPKTECVDTNLTFDFPLPSDPLMTVLADPAFLTDRGGFTNLERNYVWWNINNSQADADLLGRAYKAAWLNNYLTMVFMNVTRPQPYPNRFPYLNSELGKQFPLSTGQNTTSFTPSFNSLQTSANYGEYLDLPPSFEYLNSSTYGSGIYSNPFEITIDNFSTPYIMCPGVGGEDIANISNIAVSCGLVYGIARPADLSDVSPFYSGRPGENYTQSLFSCASAIQASIKTVTFQYNRTGDLEGLAVVDVIEKEYGDDKERPLWGVEDTGLGYIDINPLWGLIASEHENHPNLSTIRKEYLWLPGYSDGITFQPFDSLQNLPGVSFYMNALGTAYSLGSGPPSVSDYTGHTSFSIYRKWFELSQEAKSTSRIIDLIWTDIVANAVVGTRGWASSASPANLAKRDLGGHSDAALVPITVYERRVLYHLPFAIPAFILLFATFLITAVILTLGGLRRTGLSKMRKYLDQTSLGRNLTCLLYAELYSQEATRKQWLSRAAREQITLGGDRPYPIKSTVEIDKLESTAAEHFSETKPASVDEVNIPVECNP